MTSENLIKETAKAIAAIYGEPSRWANYQIDARAAIQVIAPAVLDEAAKVAPTKIRAEGCETVGQWERRALREAIRALKTRYE